MPRQHIDAINPAEAAAPPNRSPRFSTLPNQLPSHPPYHPSNQRYLRQSEPNGARASSDQYIPLSAGAASKRDRAIRALRKGVSASSADLDPHPAHPPQRDDYTRCDYGAGEYNEFAGYLVGGRVAGAWDYGDESTGGTGGAVGAAIDDAVRVDSVRGDSARGVSSARRCMPKSPSASRAGSGENSRLAVNRRQGWRRGSDGLSTCADNPEALSEPVPMVRRHTTGIGGVTVRHGEEGKGGEGTGEDGQWGSGFEGERAELAERASGVQLQRRSRTGPEHSRGHVSLTGGNAAGIAAVGTSWGGALGSFSGGSAAGGAGYGESFGGFGGGFRSVAGAPKSPVGGPVQSGSGEGQTAGEGRWGAEQQRAAGGSGGPAGAGGGNSGRREGAGSGAGAGSGGPRGVRAGSIGVMSPRLLRFLVDDQSTPGSDSRGGFDDGRRRGGDARKGRGRGKDAGTGKGEAGGAGVRGNRDREMEGGGHVVRRHEGFRHPGSGGGIAARAAAAAAAGGSSGEGGGRSPRDASLRFPKSRSYAAPKSPLSAAPQSVLPSTPQASPALPPISPSRQHFPQSASSSAPTSGRSANAAPTAAAPCLSTLSSTSTDIYSESGSYVSSGAFSQSYESSDKQEARTAYDPLTGSAPRTGSSPHVGSSPRTGAAPRTGSSPRVGSSPRTVSSPHTGSSPSRSPSSYPPASSYPPSISFALRPSSGESSASASGGAEGAGGAGGAEGMGGIAGGAAAAAAAAAAAGSAGTGGGAAAASGASDAGVVPAYPTSSSFSFDSSKAPLQSPTFSSNLLVGGAGSSGDSGGCDVRDGDVSGGGGGGGGGGATGRLEGAGQPKQQHYQHQLQHHQDQQDQQQQQLLQKRQQPQRISPSVSPPFPSAPTLTVRSNSGKFRRPAALDLGQLSPTNQQGPDGEDGQEDLVRLGEEEEEEEVYVPEQYIPQGQEHAGKTQGAGGERWQEEVYYMGDTQYAHQKQHQEQQQYQQQQHQYQQQQHAAAVAGLPAAGHPSTKPKPRALVSGSAYWSGDIGSTTLLDSLEPLAGEPDEEGEEDYGGYEWEEGEEEEREEAQGRGHRRSESLGGGSGGGKSQRRQAFIQRLKGLASPRFREDKGKRRGWQGGEGEEEGTQGEEKGGQGEGNGGKGGERKAVSSGVGGARGGGGGWGRSITGERTKKEREMVEVAQGGEKEKGREKERDRDTGRRAVEALLDMPTKRWESSIAGKAGKEWLAKEPKGLSLWEKRKVGGAGGGGGVGGGGGGARGGEGGGGGEIKTPSFLRSFTQPRSSRSSSSQSSKGSKTPKGGAGTSSNNSNSGSGSVISSIRTPTGLGLASRSFKMDHSTSAGGSKTPREASQPKSKRAGSGTWGGGLVAVVEGFSRSLTAPRGSFGAAAAAGAAAVTAGAGSGGGTGNAGGDGGSGGSKRPKGLTVSTTPRGLSSSSTTGPPASSPSSSTFTGGSQGHSPSSAATTPTTAAAAVAAAIAPAAVSAAAAAAAAAGSAGSAPAASASARTGSSTPKSAAGSGQTASTSAASATAVGAGASSSAAAATRGQAGARSRSPRTTRNKSPGKGEKTSPRGVGSKSPRPSTSPKTISPRTPRDAGQQPGSTEGIFERGFSDIRRKFDVGQQIGQGRRGVVVYMCTERRTGRQYACKAIDKGTLVEARKVAAVRAEVDVMRKLLGWPHVVGIKDALEDDKCVYIIMELCSGGDLLDHINSSPFISEREAAIILRVLAETLRSCHSHGIMHRDLKPENILLAQPGCWWDLRLADFGFSVHLKAGERMTGYAGSPFYMAPEVLDSIYGHEADVWSLGVILYTMLSQKLPFWDDTDAGVYRQIKRAEVDMESGVWPAISDEAKDLVLGMLSADPHQRITLDRLLAHPWMAANGCDMPPSPAHSTASSTDTSSLSGRRKKDIARSTGTIFSSLGMPFCRVYQKEDDDEDDDQSVAGLA
ncbi:hypothetical protein CLOM_g14333 [Closterium sp. NIES-68]|nr:hypothetical protein CLOM_g14333 [Closterium sp. NIES-68]GJP61680.1 hypothetical protein CLOP_g18829 [Closterium sp. NIES-67]